jgi:8-oxo-dGTP pyrophosphatase MutT (NUDIX family)
MQWTVHQERPQYLSDWVNVWLADVELPDGKHLEHHVLRMPKHSVTVAPLDRNRVLLLWRHRFITDAWGWEVPAGWAEPGEDPVAAAGRELEEETGWTARRLTRLCSYHAMPGLSDHKFTMFKAEGCVYANEPAEGSEAARVAWIPLDQILAMIRDGTISDGPSITALTFVLASLRA